ncbi:hypothetical protein LMF89_01785 [Pelosinus sp. Bkl1]|uniref:Uncharacterized protein n=1 Tax=Pelosinus baikalensis TaxID=2892015 RepID=A0ABS8HLN7_9FIRM|nr:hypothetical protein [Pelosinus baikalensis]
MLKVFTGEQAFVLDISIIFLMLFTFTYVGISLQYGYFDLQLAVKHIAYFAVLYILGKYIGEFQEMQIQYVLYIMTLSLALVSILGVFYTESVASKQYMTLHRGAFVPWQGSGAFSSATLLGSYLALGISLFGLAFIKSPIVLRIMNLGTSIVSVYASIELANRTGLLLAGISFLVIFLLRMRFSSTKNLMVSFLVLFLQIVIIAGLFNMDFMGISEAWEHSSTYQRMQKSDLTTDPRFEAWGIVLQGLIDDPMGGKVARLNIGFAHNLWLDVGYNTGVIPLFFLVLFTLLVIYNFTEIFGSLYYSPYMKLLLGALLTGFLLTFMVEPIMGNIILVTIFCFFSGIISSMENTAKENERVMEY